MTGDKELRTFDDAIRHCRSRGQELVSIASEHDNRQVSEACKRLGGNWCVLCAPVLRGVTVMWL